MYVESDKAVQTAKTISLNFPKATVVINGPIERYFSHGKLVREYKSHDSIYDAMSASELEDYLVIIDGRYV